MMEDLLANTDIAAASQVQEPSEDTSGDVGPDHEDDDDLQSGPDVQDDDDDNIRGGPDGRQCRCNRDGGELRPSSRSRPPLSSTPNFTP